MDEDEGDIDTHVTKEELKLMKVDPYPSHGKLELPIFIQPFFVQKSYPEKICRNIEWHKSSIPVYDA